jgi:hypothetical protein
MSVTVVGGGLSGMMAVLTLLSNPGVNKHIQTVRLLEAVTAAFTPVACTALAPCDHSPPSLHCPPLLPALLLPLLLALPSLLLFALPASLLLALPASPLLALPSSPCLHFPLLCCLHPHPCHVHCPSLCSRCLQGAMIGGRAKATASGVDLGGSWVWSDNFHSTVRVCKRYPLHCPLAHFIPLKCSKF